MTTEAEATLKSRERWYVPRQKRYRGVGLAFLLGFGGAYLLMAYLALTGGISATNAVMFPPVMGLAASIGWWAATTDKPKAGDANAKA